MTKLIQLRSRCLCRRIAPSSVVVTDLRLKDEDKDKESSFKDKDKDLMSKDEDKDEGLKIGPRGSSRTRTFLEDNNTGPIILVFGR